MESIPILFVSIGILGILSLGLLVLFVKSQAEKRRLEKELEKQAERLKTTISYVERERSLLGIELHDNVGAILSSVKLNLQNSAEKELSPEVIKNLNDAVNKVRSISQKMLPVVLSKYGLKEAIEELSGNSEKIEVSKWEDAHFSQNQSIALFRIIQECIHGSQNIRIDLAKENLESTLFIEGLGNSRSEAQLLELRTLIDVLALSIDSQIEFSQPRQDVIHIKLVVPKD